MKNRAMTEDELALQAYRQFVKDPVRLSAPCCLCGGEADTIGIFGPTGAFAKRLGQPAGKRRFFGYKVCELCIEESGSGFADRIENALLQKMGVQ